MLKFCTLDVFTDQPFSGNPLAVVLGADDLSTAQMQTIAREFNLSETIFVQTPDDPAHTAKVRIFFPNAEIPFAGHPTIGCAILLAEMAHTRDFAVTITLEEAAGLVPVNVLRSGDIISAEFTAPVMPHKYMGQIPTVNDIAAALALTPSDIGFGRHDINLLEGGPEFMYVPVASRGALSRAKICDPEWTGICGLANTNSVFVYCRDGANFCSRMFAPADGIPEDPATGSASAIFAAQLLAAGDLAEGENKFILKQGDDMGRPSTIKLKIDVSHGQIRSIKIKGTAVLISKGQIANLP